MQAAVILRQLIVLRKCEKLQKITKIQMLQMANGRVINY